MKAVPVKIEEGYRQCAPEVATHLAICIPGPSGRMFLPIITRGTRAGTGCWTWNGSIDAPTLRPSVLTKSGHFDGVKQCWCEYNKQHPNEPAPFVCFRCHTWINDGKAQFLDDCSHEFRGQTLDLLDVNTDDLQK